GRELRTRRWCLVRASDERGSGSVVAIALVAAVVTVAVAVLALSAGLARRQAVIAAADAAALAAADTALGIVPGSPCEVASRVAAANGATLTSCSVDGVVVTVQVGGSFGGIPIAAVARAGPPQG